MTAIDAIGIRHGSDDDAVTRPERVRLIVCALEQAFEETAIGFLAAGFGRVLAREHDDGVDAAAADKADQRAVFERVAVAGFIEAASAQRIARPVDVVGRR